MAGFAARAVNARDSNNGGLLRGPLAFTHHIPGDIHEHFVHMEPNISAAFDVIRQTEGGAPGQWNGGYQFDPASTVHPGRGPSGSSAAGPFQAEPRYWNDAQTGIGPTQKGVGPLDFSNDRDQQLAVIEGLRRTGSLEPLRNGNFDGFLGGPKLDGKSGAAAIWQALPVGPGNLDKSHYPIYTAVNAGAMFALGALVGSASTIWKVKNSTIAKHIEEVEKNISTLEDISIQYWTNPPAALEKLHREKMIRSSMQRVSLGLSGCCDSIYFNFRKHENLVKDLRQAVSGGNFGGTITPSPQRADTIIGTASKLRSAIRKSYKQFCLF